MIPSLICRIILVFAALMVGSTVAHGQAGQGALDKTTFGKSQNDSRDLVNSLIPGPQRPKHEKKEEVDPKKLQSKSIKDPTFGGSLVEMGLGSSGDPDLHLQKPRSAPDSDSNAPKPADAGSEKDSKVSKQADTSGEKDSKAPKSTQGGDDQNKDQKAKPAAADEKPSEKEKASATKPDPDR
jgi:hypothetical protein